MAVRLVQDFEGASAVGLRDANADGQLFLHRLDVRDDADREAERKSSTLGGAVSRVSASYAFWRFRLRAIRVGNLPEFRVATPN